MKYYVDTSVALHAVLPWSAPTARAWFDAAASGGDVLYSSTLLQLEMIRALRREQLSPLASHQITDRVNLISIDDGVLRMAGAITPHIRSLDAIHLATCTLLGSGVTVATHDARMRDVAHTLGYATCDPIGAPR